jgi:predicted phosphodiesterase/transposase
MSKTWNKDEDKILKSLVEAGCTTEEIAKELNRSYKSIQHRRANLTRGIPKFSPQTEEKPLKQKQINQMIISALAEELSEVKSYSSSEFKIVGKGDTLVIHLTDLHAGKIVKDQEGKVIFDESIFKHRVDRLCGQILKLLDNHIKRGVPITNAVILATGDNANGEDIYATQAYEQELAPPKQVMLIVATMTKLITALLDRKLTVEFYGVKGNHGRISKEANPTDNWDIMIYMVLDYWSKFVLKNSRLQIKYSETDYMTLNIRGHRFLIRHIAPEQPDTPAGRVKFNEWARMYKAEGIVYGHWHHFGLFDVDGVRVFRGGSIVGGDSLSESMAKHSEPVQCVWGVNEDRVSSFFYAVDLNEKEK